MRATILQHLQAKVSPAQLRAIYAQPAPRRVWHWNRAKLYDNLLQVVGIVGVGLLMEEGEGMEKSHSNCKYSGLSAGVEPCKECLKTCGPEFEYEFWQPKEEGKAMFKVGDRVRATKGDSTIDIGDIGTVDEKGSTCPFVKFDKGIRYAIWNSDIELIPTAPRINTTARDAVAASLRECAGKYAKRFEVAIEAIEGADRPEGVMIAKKMLLKFLVGGLPLNSSTCYFCQVRNGSCAACEYAEYHGKCMDEGSDYLKIKPEKNRLLQAIEAYYSNESYDTEHAEYMRLKAKFEG